MTAPDMPPAAPLTAEQRAELRRLAEAQQHRAPFVPFGKQVVDARQTIIVQTQDEGLAAFCAAAHPGAVLALLAEVERLREALVEAVAQGRFLAWFARAYYGSGDEGWADLTHEQQERYRAEARAALGLAPIAATTEV